MDAADLPGPTKIGPFFRLLIWLAGAETPLIQDCPIRDRDYICATGAIMLFTLIYLSALFSLIAHRLFATDGHIHPELILGSFFMGTFIVLIESQMLMRPSYYLHGLVELRKGGLDIPIKVFAHLKTLITFVVRIFQALVVAQISALIVGLSLFGADVTHRIQNDALQQNGHLIAAVTETIDAQLKRGADAYAAQSQRVAALSAEVTALRENMLDPARADPQAQEAARDLERLTGEKAKADKVLAAAEAFASDELAGIKGASGNSGHAGNGPNRRAALERVANARARVKELDDAIAATRERIGAVRSRLAATASTGKQEARNQLPAFEARLADESARLASLKDELARENAGRDAAIEEAVRHAPDYVAPKTGFLGQVAALDAVAHENPRVMAIILLVDLGSFGLELAAASSKLFAYVPTTYSMLVASETLLQAVRLVQRMMPELEGPAPHDPSGGGAAPAAMRAPIPANDNFLLGANDNFPMPAGMVSTSAPSPDETPPTPPKRPRGRPRKHPLN